MGKKSGRYTAPAPREPSLSDTLEVMQAISDFERRLNNLEGTVARFDGTIERQNAGVVEVINAMETIQAAHEDFVERHKEHERTLNHLMMAVENVEKYVPTTLGDLMDRGVISVPNAEPVHIMQPRQAGKAAALRQHEADELLSWAWGILANGAPWDPTDALRSQEWYQARDRWRDQWHDYLDKYTPTTKETTDGEAESDTSPAAPA